MTSEEEQIVEHAKEFVRKHKKAIVAEYTDTAVHPHQKHPLSIIMAGSPGAGKTEFSIRLLEIVKKNRNENLVRIDGDELRSRLPGYTGANSYLFQGPISTLVHSIHNAVLDKGQSFLLDGTCANYVQAKQNIERSLKRNREIILFYIYQRPEVAWKFTVAREQVEGRNIQKETFIRKFFAARQTVKQLVQDFGWSVQFFLVKKNFEYPTHPEEFIQIDPEIPFDQHFDTSYTEDEVANLL